ncbi:septal ring lytic transglycosylase RlpA family protein [Sphingomonas naphthae]|uniref:Endolytic peptidoglycan transglycosylase RlpA n=1 Tax=Sphingomonas naphthae TaxID=1813468 RepID=A0ABY7TPU0_9SPHN|nr:septal ring lytic transglycosylase RlpA family protein [Sphingomonas naphthae]WCT75006.1 septal ring lytic transglycosylase RlpA family protein [Sphingomonas naphthae]
MRSWNSRAGLASLLVLAACSSGPRRPEPVQRPPARGETPRPPRGPVADFPVKVGKPYTVLGITYTPVDDPSYDEVGIASWYGDDFHGGQTANGERYDMDMVGAAHKTMPLPSYAEVTSLRTGKRIIVRVNDRGPFVPNRIIDLSRKAAQMLGIDRAGIGPVRVRRVFPDERDRLALRSGDTARDPAFATSSELDQDRRRLLARAPDPRPVTPQIIAPAMAQSGWYAQVGAYGDPDRAAKVAKDVGGQVTFGEGLYRVRVGPFADEPSATLVLAQLGARGYHGGRLVKPFR